MIDANPSVHADDGIRGEGNAVVQVVRLDSASQVLMGGLIAAVGVALLAVAYCVFIVSDVDALSREVRIEQIYVQSLETAMEKHGVTIPPKPKE